MKANESTKFESWAIIELFGHNRLAGHVTEQTIGGCAFIRVDVPAIEARKTKYGDCPAVPAFTKYLTQGAIYAMTPCSEDAAYKALEEFRSLPVNAFDLCSPSQPERELPFVESPFPSKRYDDEDNDMDGDDE